VTGKVGGKVREKETDMLDAPTAQGVKAANVGTVADFVGGKRETFERWR
jgi:3-hydroxyisobutyrate dehydrogenase-like beta-hydroxyacid dehydrogenase